MFLRFTSRPRRVIVACLSASLTFAATALTPDLTWVGGAPMFPTRTIYQNLIGSADHTHLTDAIEAGGLITTLDAGEPFTVFAPTNAAFRTMAHHPKAPRTTGRTALRALAGHHMVPGRLTTARLIREIRAADRVDDGVVRYATWSRSVLSFRLADGRLQVIDAGGRRAAVSIADVRQANGLVHVIDTVMRPE